MATSFKSILSAVGHDIGVGVKDVFGFLGSARGQSIIKGVEGAAALAGSAINPTLGLAIQGGEALFNTAMTKALEIEAGASAVGAQAGTGTQKGIAVTSYLAGEAEDFLTSVGVPKPTADQVQTLATKFQQLAADVWNMVPAPSTVKAPTTTTGGTAPLLPATGGAVLPASATT
jgi:hypothetical protein